ncbi:MAG: hypothetical protein K6F80_00175 [Oscillospiraceae bacterium]|nr:hypothetical protein [Oscillospiraceae bacterium]
MNAPLLRLRTQSGFVPVGACLGLSLVREMYTPYESLSGLFLIDEQTDISNVSAVELLWEETSIFLGIADRIEKICRDGVWMLRVRSRTFPSLLTQNELEAGLHSNLTLQSLVSGFYTIPNVTAEENSQTGYIFVRDGTTLWDSVAVFVYKISGRYPFVQNNHVRFSLDATPAVHVPAQITQTAEKLDSTRIFSHFHMEDMQGNPDAYQLETVAARQFQIVRHRQIGFDRQFLSDPNQALSFRSRFSCRDMRSRCVSYAGFENEQLGEKVRCGQFLQDKIICKVQLTFGAQGLRTSLWAYEDGFYNQSL